MERVRKFIDVRLRFAIKRQSAPENLNDANDIIVLLCNDGGARTPCSFSISPEDTSVLEVFVSGNNLKLGVWRLVVRYTKTNSGRTPPEEPFAVDAIAYECVQFTTELGGDNECGALEIQQIDLNGEIGGGVAKAVIQQWDADVLKEAKAYTDGTVGVIETVLETI